MKSVILGDRLDPMLRVLEHHPGPLVYIQLTVTRESLQVRDYLRRRPNTQELPAGELFRDRRESFRKKYIQLIGRLNKSNQCLEWWGSPLTDKMPNRPDLYRNVAYFLLIVELVRLRTETLVVISDSADLGAQVSTWASRGDAEVVNLIRTPWSWRRVLKHHSPAGIIAAFFRMACGRWLFSRRYWPPPNTQDAHIVINSLTHLRSFAEPGVYRDAYFAPLIESLAKSGHRALILAGVQEQPVAQLKRLKTVSGHLPILPLEACLTLGGMLSGLVRALTWYFKARRVRGPAEIDGVDVSCLVNRAVREEQHSGNLFMNLGVYQAARKLAKTLSVTHWVYPFENLAWEKMLLLGAYSASNDLQMIGYQHASLTKSHIDLLLPEDREAVMPLPKSIITTGDVTRDWLEAEGNYPSEIVVRTGCALRQTPAPTIQAKPREPRLTKLLVALATNLEEYVRVFVFLEEAFSGKSGYEVKIRPHPSIPLEPALASAPVSHPEFRFGGNGPLSEDLQWADAVLYASSTVGLEAIQLGIPAIYLDLGNVLDTDPLLGWREFKWPVTEPSGLVDALQRIEAIPEHEFQRLQRLGQDYAAAYLKPVTAQGLQAFWGEMN